MSVSNMAIHEESRAGPNYSHHASSALDYLKKNLTKVFGVAQY